MAYRLKVYNDVCCWGFYIIPLIAIHFDKETFYLYLGWGWWYRIFELKKQTEDVV